MDLKIKDELFIVAGAGSGLGRGVAQALLREGARIIAIGRDPSKLDNLAMEHPEQVEIYVADVFMSDGLDDLYSRVGDRKLSGMLVNAGGPPAKSFIETELADWDEAYNSLLRWKIKLIKMFLPRLISQEYGRIVLIESSAVKQPVENLVLSNSIRLAVVGFVKTLSQEVAGKGVTLNILAPGFHDTPAVERLFVKRSENEGITVEEARRRFEAEILMGRMGNPGDFGSLAAWLLSPLSGYITGQTISVDGGFIKGTMG